MTDRPPETAQRRAARNSGLLSLGKMLATGIEAIVPILVVRILDKPAANTLFELILVLQVLAAIFSAGLPNTLSYYLPGRGPGERRTIAQVVQRSGMFLGGSVALLVLLLGGWAGLAGGGTPFETFHHLMWASLYPAGEIALRLLPNMLVVEDRARWSALVPMWRSLVFSGALLIPIALGAGPESVTLGLGVIGAVNLCVSAWVFHRVYHRIPKVVTDIKVGQVLRFGVPLGLTEVTNTLNGSLDRALIWLLVGSTLLADYAVGAWQFPAIPALAYAIGVSYTPMFAANFRAGRPAEAIRVWKHQISKTALVVVPLAMVLIVAAEEIVELLFTAEYSRAADVFRCYSLVTLGRVTAYGNLLVAANRPDLVARCSALGLLTNLAISIPLALTVGFLGPAIGTVCAFVIMVSIYIFYIAEVSGASFGTVFPFGRYFGTVGLAAAGGALAFATKGWVDMAPWVTLLATIGIVGVVFTSLAFALGLVDKDDLHLVRRKPKGDSAQA